MSDQNIFPISAQQTADIARWLEVFSKADDDDTAPSVKWGGGYRAVLGVKRVPIHTDADGVIELLGWIERGDFGWYFTQVEAK